MIKHEVFHYRTLKEVKDEVKRTKSNIPLNEDFRVLFTPINIGHKTIANRFVIQPLECCDGDKDGTPSDLGRRRYIRLAKSGASIHWFEPIAVVAEGRSTANELMISRKNLDIYKRIIAEIRDECFKQNGFAPILIPQLTHSGRFSNPTSQSKQPIIATHNSLLEGQTPLPDECIATDDYLGRLEERYLETALLCNEAGFDGVDIKACHGYLINELLASYNRPGMYGGSLENRTRFLLNCSQAIRASVGKDFMIACRLNAYDGFPYPYGFGVNPNGINKPDYSEPIQVARKLHDQSGVELINVTLGIGYINPHILRPHDRGNYKPDEHPFTGISRHVEAATALQLTLPTYLVIGSALSYLRQYSPYHAAGMILEGRMKLAGFGRMALAYPEFIHDLRNKGQLDLTKVCVTCSQCTLRLRGGLSAGCVIRDTEFYKPIRKKE